MSKRSPISSEIKLRAVRRRLQYESNPNHEAKQLGVHRNTVSEWIRKYQADGKEGLGESKGWESYSKELKRSAIQDVLSGEYSVRGSATLSWTIKIRACRINLSC
ncbi:helix-turn-helix domain-containing protein [Paenibacillus sp. P96]|uniref:Helix-turn-helix domain-containing protein n=1 Tax=Paenibacillus zeirhizosphaerae TaxID=2987519 RepID=A0ABT9FP50_9BACL|nr:helix-turn-helix domain-containing protein [Paenibacillus sp. P96]MDP4096505.1 helix-turn-helix domain-containing protein [Paenibacillus sp. P96]